MIYGRKVGNAPLRVEAYPDFGRIPALRLKMEVLKIVMNPLMG